MVQAGQCGLAAAPVGGLPCPLIDLEQPSSHLGPQLRLGHVLQHEFGLQHAAELAVGGVEAVRGLEAVEPLQGGGRGGVTSGERRIELAEAVPLLGDEAEVHRPPAALEDRLGRSLGQIVAILDALAKAGVAFVALKENIRVEGKHDIQTTVMTTLFALFAEVERTREGLARARSSGRNLGRPKGSLGVSRLIGKEDDIRRFLELGVSKTAIAKLTGVSRTTSTAS